MSLKTEGPSKLIVCILPQGNGIVLVDRLSQEMAINSANVSTGRGRGAGPVGSIGAWDEVDTLAVTVPANRAEEIFAFIYEAAEVGRPRGGIMYQHAVASVTTFTLPEIDPDQST